MTVRELLEHIEKNNIPMDAEVFVERVKDVYFNECGWEVVKKEGFMYNQQKELIDKAKSGEFNNKEEYPLMSEGVIEGIIDSEQSLDETKVEYIDTFCGVKYKGDNNLYIDCHY